MTKHQNAWSVRGVSREARSQAKNAARKRRVTTGEWISLTLIAVADEELVVSAQSLPAIGSSSIAPLVDEKAIDKMGPRGRELYTRATKRLGPNDRAEKIQQAPWSIRGVSEIARLKLAKGAAHRGVTSGEWVNHAIQVFAGREAGVEPAPTTQKQRKDQMSQASERTVRPVDTLTGPFDATGMSDRPDKTLVRLPDMAPEVTTETSPAIIPGWPVNDTEPTEQKISELADRVDGAEHRDEKPFADLKRVLTTAPHSLHLSGNPATNTDRNARVEPQGEPAKAVAKLSEAEMVYWESIKDSNDFDAYESYLESFPHGLFASLARRRLARAAREDPGYSQPPPPEKASSRPLRRRPAPAHVLPKFDYETLNERAIENTKCRN